jgi:hypothetical protein
MTGVRLTGGCQCGAVRYALAEVPPEASICHCRMCQKAFGSYFAPLASVSTGAFKVTRGEVAIFRSSELAERGFCRDCGTPLTFRYLDQERISVALGSLDDPASLKPVTAYGVQGMVPWFADLASLPGERDDADPDPRLSVIARTNHQHPDHDTVAWPEGHG